jgi:uncharacterized SAM-binding protein YcdF (DUF218 family)
MLSELKPYVTTIILPPASLLVIILIGGSFIRGKPWLAKLLIHLAVTALWLFSTSGFSVWLHSKVIPEYPLITENYFKSTNAEAIVILGGGVVVGLPDGDQQMSRTSLERLRLGAQLARQSSLPIVFSGGSGWGVKVTTISEADVAEKVLKEAFGLTLKFKESRSRDTQENAIMTRELLTKHGIQHIILVTHSSHMPRASEAFKNAGFDVEEAALGQPVSSNGLILSWLPNANNLEVSQSIFRELLARFLQKLTIKKD